MLQFTSAAVPWFRADGTNVFWHPPKTGVFGGKTVDDTASFFAPSTPLLGKPCAGAKVFVKLAETPNAATLPVLCKLFANDEATLIGQWVLGSGAPTSALVGPIDVPPSTYAAAPNHLGGFCVKLFDHTAGAALTLATYTVMVWWTPMAAPTAG